MDTILIWWNVVNIWIDADGCPVVEETIEIAMAYDVPVTIVCDSAHVFVEAYARVLRADKGRDKSDFLILKHVAKGDLVITQDYGLAALVLSKGARALSQNGLVYNGDNMNALLNSRHEHAIQRKHKHFGHTPKRTKEDDFAYMDALEEILREIVGIS